MLTYLAVVQGGRAVGPIGLQLNLAVSNLEPGQVATKARVTRVKGLNRRDLVDEDGVRKRGRVQLLRERVAGDGVRKNRNVKAFLGCRAETPRGTLQ